MSEDILVLTATAATIGIVHTLLGPDHYLPFIMMSRARDWSSAKTSWITVVCGVGHVLGSIALGILGIALGLSLGKLEAVESFRGNLAALFLIVFGLGYFLWGVHRARKGLGHTHLFGHQHQHEAGTDSGTGHIHSHGAEEKEAPAEDMAEGDRLFESGETKVKQNITPWVLFTIFAFGPCEPLIPVLMYPAADSNVFGVVLVALVFSVATIGTMLAVVTFSSSRVNRLPLQRFEKHTHAIAGATIFLSGMAIQFLGI